MLSKLMPVASNRPRSKCSGDAAHGGEPLAVEAGCDPGVLQRAAFDIEANAVVPPLDMGRIEATPIGTGRQERLADGARVQRSEAGESGGRHLASAPLDGARHQRFRYLRSMDGLQLLVEEPVEIRAVAERRVELAGKGLGAVGSVLGHGASSG